MEKKEESLTQGMRPRRTLTYHRLELYGLLDELIRVPIILINASPGLGKTTLIAGYTEFRDIPCLWYQMDGKDKNLDDFLNHLRVAVLKLISCDGVGLPQATIGRASSNDFQIGMYFKKLFSFFKKPFVIVFDDYQRLPKESPLHDAIAEASKVLPSWGRIVLIADDDSSIDVSRFRAHHMIATLDRHDLELSRDEIKKISALHGVRLTKEQVTSQIQGNAGLSVGGLTQKLKDELRRTGCERPIFTEAGNT